jgi:hypothetical protein
MIKNFNHIYIYIYKSEIKYWIDLDVVDLTRQPTTQVMNLSGFTGFFY